MSVHLSGSCLVTVCHNFEFPIPAVLSQNVSNKSYLVYVESEAGPPSDPWGLWGKAKFGYEHDNTF